MLKSIRYKFALFISLILMLGMLALSAVFINSISGTLKDNADNSNQALNAAVKNHIGNLSRTECSRC